ncbi:MAG: hypothetical protein R3B95_10280, partial [Nitrospirales bacterium]|nr:hypothetical protein [Nitrospirales bacterium]
ALIGSFHKKNIWGFSLKGRIFSNNPFFIPLQIQISSPETLKNFHINASYVAMLNRISYIALVNPTPEFQYFIKFL